MMGVNQSAMNIQKATVSATSPVLPPSLMPVADSAGKQAPFQAKHCRRSTYGALLPDRAHQAAIHVRHRKCAAACMSVHTYLSEMPYEDHCEAMSVLQSTSKEATR